MGEIDDENFEFSLDRPFQLRFKRLGKSDCDANSAVVSFSVKSVYDANNEIVIG